MPGDVPRRGRCLPIGERLRAPDYHDALAGVAAALWVADPAFTREATVGVILVIGLAVNQSILLVDAVLERRRTTGDGRHPLSAAQLLAACWDRSDMILLVTFTTLASLLPLAIGTSSDSLFGAIALATSGGMVRRDDWGVVGDAGGVVSEGSGGSGGR